MRTCAAGAVGTATCEGIYGRQWINNDSGIAVHGIVAGGGSVYGSDGVGACRGAVAIIERGTCAVERCNECTAIVQFVLYTGVRVIEANGNACPTRAI